MKKNIGIIGGDLRNIELAKIFSQSDFLVKTFGLLENDERDLNNFLNDTNYIISGIPFTRDGEVINTPNCKEKIGIERLFNSINQGQTIFAGSISEKVKNLANRYDVRMYDLLKDEDMAVLNAIPSAEGAVEIALKNMKKTIHSSNCLILGYGRIGKVLASILKGFNANVFVAARKEEDMAWIKAMGYNSLKYENLSDSIKNFDVIFNTVPSTIIDEKELASISLECIIIDLASAPGGINFEKAKELNIETYWALGLPGKVAPKSVAEYMFDKIIKLI